MKRTLRGSALAAVSVAVAVAAALPAHATPMSVSEVESIPASVTFTTDVVSCDNTSSTIDLSGSLGVGGLGLQTIFKNNTKGTKEVVVGTSASTVFDASVSDLPKQPVADGVGGNPYISVAVATQNADGSYTMQSTPTIVGRCVQGVSLPTVTQTFNLPTPASTLATALTCDSKGSTINLDSSATTPSLYAVLVFDNNKNKVVHRSVQPGDVIVPLAGGSTHKGWGQSQEAGGNPLVYLQYDDGNPNTTNPEYYLGRCKDLL